MIKKLSQYIGEYKNASIVTPLYIIGEAIMEQIIPLLMAMIVDNGIGKSDMGYVTKVGIIMVVVSIVSLTFGALAGKYAAKASAGFAKNLRKAMFYNIQDFSFSNIDKYSTAGLITRLTTDVTNVQNAYQMVLRMLVRAPIMLIIAMIMSFSINVKLALIFVGAMLFLGIILYFIMTKAHPYFKAVFEKYDDLNASVQENLTGMRVVKAYVREEHEIEKFNKSSKVLYDFFIRAEKVIVLNMPVMQFSMYTCMPPRAPKSSVLSQ